MGNFIIPFDTIKLKKFIGQGTFGTVFAATSYRVKEEKDLFRIIFIIHIFI